jgi:hypothetical protein
MRHHLTSLHASIWDIVEFGAQVPKVGDEGTTRTRLPKLGTLTPKPKLYSSPPCVERSIIRCKGVNHLGPFGNVLVINDNCLWTNDFWRNKNAGLDHIEQEMLKNHTHWLWIK